MSPSFRQRYRNTISQIIGHMIAFDCQTIVLQHWQCRWARRAGCINIVGGVGLRRGLRPFDRNEQDRESIPQWPRCHGLAGPQELLRHHCLRPARHCAADTFRDVFVPPECARPDCRTARQLIYSPGRRDICHHGTSAYQARQAASTRVDLRKRLAQLGDNSQPLAVGVVGEADVGMSGFYNRPVGPSSPALVPGDAETPRWIVIDGQYLATKRL